MARIRIKINSGLIKFRTIRDGESTAALELPGGDFEYELEGDFEVSAVEKYVSVKLVRSGGTGGLEGEWTYIDPWGNLDYGDVVRVPFGVANRLFLGKVVATDVERPSGLYVKTVAQRARFEDE